MSNELIKAAAKIEQNVSLSGNEKMKLRPAEYDEPRRVINVKGKEYEVNAKAYVSPLAYKYIVRLDEKPVIWEHVKSFDPNLRVTKGLYMIKYTPKGSDDYRKSRPFKIGQDLIRWDIRVAGKRHWHMLCDKIPELKWLERNSTLTDFMFDLAVRHPGMSFVFTIKWEEYDKKLQSQSEQFIDHSLVSRKCSFEDYENIYKADDKPLMIRYLNDVLKEIQEVEMSKSVQEEMITGTGEATILREQYIKGHGGVHQPRDPATGRFINKNQEEK